MSYSKIPKRTRRFDHLALQRLVTEAAGTATFREAAALVLCQGLVRQGRKIEARRLAIRAMQQMPDSLVLSRFLAHLGVGPVIRTPVTC